MAGANMMVVYAGDSTNVTVSPRLGVGHVQPQFNSDASISVLEGSGITSDGTLVANIRCDSCLSWSGGSMSPTDSSSNWIFAFKSGDALDSTDQSADISQHDSTGTFNLDLTTGTGGSSSNPFVAASDSPSSSASGTQPTAAESGTATTSTVATATGPVSIPLASSDPTSSSGAAFSSSPSNMVRIGHATVMSLVFVLLFPLSALTLYLPYANKVRVIHAPLQIISLILMLVGLALGVKLGNQVSNLDGYHMVLGYILVAWLGIFQPVLGLLQHLHFRRMGTRSIYGHGHRLVGRAMLCLGVVNGGLGFKIAGGVGSADVPTYAVAVYSVFAVLVFLICLAVLFFSSSSRRAESARALPGEKPRPRPRSEAYEMHGNRL